MAHTTKVLNSTENVSSRITFDGNYIEVKKWMILDHDKSEYGSVEEFRYELTLNKRVICTDVDSDTVIEHLVMMAAGN